MSARSRVALGVLVVVVLLGAVFWIRAGSAKPAGRLVVAGDVRSDIRTISAPLITYPTPDYTVGIPKPAGSSAGSAKRGGSTASSSRQPVVAGMLAKVLVNQGDTVKAGDVVAEFDTKLLALGVEQAKTASRKSHKDVGVMSHNIDKLATASSKLATARAKIATAKAAIFKGRAALLKARRQILVQRAQLLKLKAQRPQLKAQLAALQAQAAHFPPGHVPPAIVQGIAKIQGLLAAIDPGLAGIAKGLVLINTNLAKINKGLAQLPAAYAQLNAAAKKIVDAKVTLRDAKDVLKIVAKGSNVGIRIANARLALAEVRTPVGGVVTFARQGGTVAMVGAPLVRVCYDGPQLVDTYLTSEQAQTIGIGSAADVTYDSSRGEVLHGKVSVIGSAYLFPPTSFPTQVVHMTRTLKVTIALNQDSSVPPGTPVDLSIATNTKN